MSPHRRPAPTPVIPTPPHFVDRRVTFRRQSDRLAHEESVLLARALDILAAPRPAEHRLAELLVLIARTAGAERAAVLAEGEERLVAVAIAPDEDPAEAEALARWLDAAAPRPRAARAAAPPAGIAIVAGPPKARRRKGAREQPAEPHYLLREIPGGGGAVLGFAFASARRARAGADRLPPAMARHAAVALALVSRQVAEQRELADLRRREAERTQFVGMIVHEFRTPLTSLRGYLDLLHGNKVVEADVREEFLGRSRNLVEGLGALVNDLLEMTRLETGNLGLTISPFSAAEAAHAVVEQLMPQAMARQITMRATTPSRLRTTYADRQRAMQILTNLAANAIKFSSPGGRVEVQVSFEGPVAVYVVRDDGPGIGEDDRPRIFDRFYRATKSARVTGAGLGLSISRDLARAMDGDLGFATETGRGTSFVLALPAQQDVAAEAIAAVLYATLATEQAILEGADAAWGARFVAGVTRPPIPKTDREHVLIPAALALSALRTRQLRAVDGVLAAHDAAHAARD